MNYKYLLILPVLLFLSCQKEELSNLNDSFTLRRNGADMPAYVYGNALNKTFLVMLHGGPGGSGLSLRSGWHKKVEEQYGVVYWDQRGSGMSQGHLSGNNLNLDEMKKDLIALVEVLKHKYGEDIDLFLMGHSWGGTYGTALFTDDNGAVQGLFKGWIHASAGYAWCPLWTEEYHNFKTIAEAQIKEGNEVNYWEEGIELANDIDLASCNDFRLNTESYKAETILQKSGVINPNSSSTTFQSTILQNNISTTNTTLYSTNDFLFLDKEFASLDLSEELQEITLPTLVIHGKYDLAVPYSIGTSYFEAINSTEKELVTLEKSGHQIFHTDPDIVTTAVLDFIALYK